MPPRPPHPGPLPHNVADNAGADGPFFAATSRGRGSKSLRLFVLGITSIGLSFAPPQIATADEKKAEAPPGYEDAVAADEKVVDAAVEEGAALGKKEEEDREKKEVEKDDANVLKIERQFLRHFQKIFDSERSFIPRVCDLTKQQRGELVKATAGIPEAAARRYAIWQSKLGRRAFRVNRGRNPTALEPRNLILDELKRAVRECLPPTQTQAYEAELIKRATHRKQTAVLNLVAKLDEDLVLTAEQRAKLTQSLTTNWQAAWAQSLQLFRHNNRFLPHIPNRHIVPILNPTQRAVWNGAQKQNIQSWGGMGFGNAIVFVDDFDIEIEAENDDANKKR